MPHCKITERLASSLVLSIAFGVMVGAAFATVLSHITIYQSTRSLFMCDWAWASQMAEHLGGATDYLTSLVGALCQWVWLGATVIGAMAAAVLYLLLRRRELWWLALVPVFYLVSGYELTHFLDSLVGVLLVVVIFSAWRSVRGVWLRMALMVVALVVGFIVSPSAFLVLVILVVGDVLFDVRLALAMRLVGVALALVVVLSLQWLVGLVFVVNPSVVSSTIFGGQKSHIDFVFFALIALVVFLSYLPLPKSWVGCRLLTPVMCGVVTVVGAVILAVTFRPELRMVMRAEQATDAQEWAKVLQITDQQAVNNPLVQYMRTVALFRRGELVDKIFDTPQLFGPNVLFIPWQKGNSSLQIKLADLAWINVGIVNEAMRLSFESMTGSGANRVNMAHLLHYNRLAGHRAMVSKLERRLSRTLFYDSQKSIAGFTPNPVLRGGVDSVYTSTDNPTLSLHRALAVDSTNRAAADYLALIYLLSTDLDGFVSLVPRLKVLYGGHLPRVYQEALAFYRIMADADSSLVFENYAIDRSVHLRLEEFNREARDPENMSPENKRSYWYYMLKVMMQQKSR
ncbi:MAG: DUF6057 family protein [Mucinivorans sp.]